MFFKLEIELDNQETLTFLCCIEESVKQSRYHDTNKKFFIEVAFFITVNNYFLMKDMIQYSLKIMFSYSWFKFPFLDTPEMVKNYRSKSEWHLDVTGVR